MNFNRIMFFCVHGVACIALCLHATTTMAEITFVAEDFDGNTVGEFNLSDEIVSAADGSLPTAVDPMDSTNTVGSIRLTGGHEWQRLFDDRVYDLPMTTVPGTDEFIFSYRVYIPSAANGGIATLGTNFDDADSVNSIIRLNGTRPDAYPPSILNVIDSLFPFDQWVEVDDGQVIPVIDNTNGSLVTSFMPIFSIRDISETEGFVQNEAGFFGYVDDVRIGVTESIVLPLECDFDGDGACDLTDIDTLSANFGGSLVYDVNQNGVVEAGDIGAWLTEASKPTNTYLGGSQTFVIGDVDLNGFVNSLDLGIMLNNFDGPTGAFSGGNMNDDDTVNSIDLGLLLNNFDFGSSASVVVPEPNALTVLFLITVGWFSLWGRRNGRN